MRFSHSSSRVALNSAVRREQNGCLRPRRNYLPGLVVLLLAGLFVLCGWLLIPYPGIQNDEALFADAIYAPAQMPSYVSVFKKPVALMLMSYLGTLKAWLYAPVFAFAQPSVYSLRAPVLLLGALTILLSFQLLKRILGPGAAAAGAALLATDSTYLLTTVFDWGPVVLQHLLGLGGVLALVWFHRTGRRRYLGLGFFLFGLALWDKALFGWSLAGLGVALLCVHPRALLRVVSASNVAVAAVFFTVGAFPLIRYNVREPLATFSSNVAWSAEDRMTKIWVLRNSFDGCGLLGYLSFEDHAGQERAPRTALERISVRLDDATGRPRRGWLIPAMLAALLLLPLFWRTRARRPMLFALVFMIVVWLQMFLGREVGGTVHHTVLLWPWPQALVAGGLAGLLERWPRVGRVVAPLVVAAICARGLLSTNVQLSQLIRNGATSAWTDAIFPLSDYVSPVRAERYALLDWGMSSPLRLLHRGRLHLEWAADQLTAAEATDQTRAAFRRMAEAPGRVYIMHTAPFEIFTGVNARLAELLAGEGFRKQPLAVIPDSHGREVFEVFRIATD